MGQTFVYNAGTHEIEKGTYELVYGVFIDGTLNNKDNTDLRNKYGRGSDTNPDYSSDNKWIESNDDVAYKDVKNKDRIEALLANKYRTPEEQAELDKIPEQHKYLVASHRTAMDKRGTDNSFSNDYTNVARMWKFAKPSPYAVYVAGMGTDKMARDSQDGFAFGAGLTGIRARVRDACKQIAEQISLEKKSHGKDILDKITLDVFGFSRGAATARNFMYEVKHNSGYAKIKNFKIPDGFYPINPYSTRDEMPKQKYRSAKVDVDEMEVDETVLDNGSLPKMGHLGYCLLQLGVFDFEELKDINVSLRFIGLYETVSSYYEPGGIGEYDESGNVQDGSGFKLANEALGTNFNTNIGPLHLNDLGGGRYQQLVHFTAKDEHRRNFSLTRIPNANNANSEGEIDTIERNFPGVHCDIGGAYMTEIEEVDEVGTNLSDSQYKTNLLDLLPGSSLFHTTGLEALKQDLIAQHWFKDDGKELKIKWQWGWRPPFTSFKKLSSRRYIKKEYSYIPLHFMEEYAMKTQMKDYIVFPIVKNYPLDSFLESVKGSLHEYAVYDEKNYYENGFKNELDWEFIPDEVLKKQKEVREENERIQKEFEQSLAEHNLEQKPVYDNLDPADYMPQVILEQIVPIVPEETPVAPVDPNAPIEPPAIELAPVVVYGTQNMLRKLRHEYLHWSSNRDWFGMEPNDDRKRVEIKA